MQSKPTPLCLPELPDTRQELELRLLISIEGLERGEGIEGQESQRRLHERIKAHSLSKTPDTDTADKHVTHTIPEMGFVRLKQILAVIPIGKTCWWEGVKSGRFPKPVKLSERCTAWKAEDIRELIKTLGEQGSNAKCE
jgi:predicted DNA-binding transcriptional regulator AlpA